MTLFLHIGLGKVGSSSIQTTLAANRDSLARQGLIWPDIMQEKSGRYSALVKALRDEKDARRLKHFRDFVRQTETEGRSTVVSSELLSGLSTDELERFAEFVPVPPRIAVYVRPYHEMVISAHLQFIRMRGTRPFRWDRNVSFRSTLERWARVFGAPSIRVRRTDDVGDVVQDFLAFVGGSANPVQSNRTPHSLTTEMLALASKRRVDKDIVLELSRLIDPLIRESGVAPIRYLTPADEEELGALYRQDCAWMAAQGFA